VGLREDIFFGGRRPRAVRARPANFAKQYFKNIKKARKARIFEEKKLSGAQKTINVILVGADKKYGEVGAYILTPPSAESASGEKGCGVQPGSHLYLSKMTF
jgi:hypothetical protein